MANVLNDNVCTAFTSSSTRWAIRGGNGTLTAYSGVEGGLALPYADWFNYEGDDTSNAGLP